MGDLVLIGNDNTKRIEWPLGRVIARLPGRDDQIRVYRIKTKEGELLRPIQRLYPLEIDCSVKNDDRDNEKIVKSSCEKIRKIKSVNGKSDFSQRNDNVQQLTKIGKPYVTRSGRIVRTRFPPN